jgi:SAM-dependent methyltransferase
MTTFHSLYAKHYDLMYADKTYDAETAYVLQALESEGVPSGRILSIGAGTLTYELLIAKQGYEIDSIDLSADMVEQGRAKLKREGIQTVTVAEGDMRALVTPAEPYDAALVLFNVVSYLKDHEELVALFSGLARSLHAGGTLVLDYWNGEAIRTSPPQSRWKKFTTGDVEVYRLTEVTNVADTAVTLEIELLELEGKKLIARSLEIHHVRGWDREEMKAIAREAGFEIVHESAFPEWDTPPVSDRWPLGAVWRKTG